MSTCPSSLVERAAIWGVFLAVAITLSIRTLMHPTLHKFRKNPVIFLSVSLGCLTYIAFSVIMWIDYVHFPLPLWVAPLLNCIITVCHFAILLERVSPLLRIYQKTSSSFQMIAKVILSNLFAIGAWIQVVGGPEIFLTGIFINVAMTTVNKIAFSAIFLTVLLHNRAENTLLVIILRNKRQWAQLGFCIIAWATMLVIQILFMSYIPVGNFIFQFAAICYHTAILLSFDSFLYITDSVTKDILHSNIAPTRHKDSHTVKQTIV
ncbi:hypothetical protein BKA69DRAFT_1045158, partial [Paraphysoderma sedebokerense]